MGPKALDFITASDTGFRPMDPAGSSNNVSYFANIRTYGRPAIYIEANGMNTPTTTTSMEDGDVPDRFLVKLGNSYVDSRRVAKELGTQVPPGITSKGLTRVIEESGYSVADFDTAHSLPRTIAQKPLFQTREEEKREDGSTSIPSLSYPTFSGMDENREARYRKKMERRLKKLRDKGQSQEFGTNYTPMTWKTGNLQFTVNAVYEVIPSVTSGFNALGLVSTLNTEQLITTKIPYDNLRQAVDSNWFYWEDVEGELGAMGSHQ